LLSLISFIYYLTGNSGGHWQRQRWQTKFGWIYRYVLVFCTIVNNCTIF